MQSEVFYRLQKVVLVHLSQFPILVLSVETRHIGGAHYDAKLFCLSVLDRLIS